MPPLEIAVDNPTDEDQADTNPYTAKTAEDLVSEFIGAHGSRIPDADWERIEPEVRAAVAAMRFKRTHEAKNYFTVCTRFIDWGNRVAGHPLDLATLFRPEIIDNFVERGCPDLALSTRATYRSRLLQVSDKLLARPYRSANSSSMGTFANASVPYTADEIRRLRNWASRQRTQYRRVNAAMLLSLGLGAGLSTSEIISTTAGDVDVDDDGVVINVAGQRARAVPMRAEWESDVAALASSAMRPSLYLFGAKRRVDFNANLVAAFLEDASRPPVRLNAQRMRATWIVGHLANRVPPTALAKAAGLAKVEGLARFAAFVPDADQETVRAWLRDERARERGTP